MNLLKNAFESMASADCDKREVMATCSVAGAAGRISIADTGGGIPEESQPTIFDAFVTTRKEGMGMGLAISRTIMEGHDGRICLQQGTTEGAVFDVELPLHDPTHHADEVADIPNSENASAEDDHVVVQEA